MIYHGYVLHVVEDEDPAKRVVLTQVYAFPDNGFPEFTQSFPAVLVPSQGQVIGASFSWKLEGKLSEINWDQKEWAAEVIAQNAAKADTFARNAGWKK